MQIGRYTDTRQRLSYSLTVQSGLPIPDAGSGPGMNSRGRYTQRLPLPLMEPGDSFFDPYNMRNGGALQPYVKRGWRFVSRMVVEDGHWGVRIWRVK